MPQAPKTLNTFDSILQVVKDLRGLEGCPWDREQNHQTLTPYAIEEVHEMAEAIESGDDAHIQEELGDVLFQVILHAQIAEERGAFNIADVIETITSKIVRRHPHVFSDTKVSGSDEVMKNWDEIKKLEKKNKKENIFSVPPSLPALQRAHKIGEKTEKYKFDWSESRQVLKQLKAEITELEEVMDAAADNLLLASDTSQNSALNHEMGDVLFSAAQLARHLQIEPEASLREANRRFISRFEKMLLLSGSLENFIALSSEAKERLWAKVKNST